MSDRHEETEAQAWLRFALSDVRSARSLLTVLDSDPNTVCVLAQQGVEKALKAVLVHAGVRVARTHDLLELRSSIGTMLEIRLTDHDLISLTDWMIKGRYPGDWTEASRDDAIWAVRSAEVAYADVCDRLTTEEIQA